MFEHEPGGQPSLLTLVDVAVVANNPRTRSAKTDDLTDFARFGHERRSTNATIDAVGAPKIRVPLDLDLIAAYIDHLRVRGAKASTIRRRLCTLAAFHKQHRIENDPRKDPTVAAAWARAVATEGRAADRKLAVAETALHHIIKTMDDHFEATASVDRRFTLSYLRDRALLLLEYAGCLTRTEIATLSVDNVTFSGTRARLRVNRSGEMLEAGRLVWVNPDLTRDVEIQRADDPTYCAVLALRRWLNTAHITEGYVFRGILIRGTLTERLSGRAILDVHEHRAGLAGLEKNVVSSHGVRTGVIATRAYEGASDTTLRELANLRELDSVADVVARSRTAARHGSKITLV